MIEVLYWASDAPWNKRYEHASLWSQKIYGERIETDYNEVKCTDHEGGYRRAPYNLIRQIEPTDGLYQRLQVELESGNEVLCKRIDVHPNGRGWKMRLWQENDTREVATGNIEEVTVIRDKD